MERYFFDTRDDGSIIVDDIGTRLSGVVQAREVAATALAEMALDVLPGSIKRCLGVDVRDSHDKPVLTTELAFQARMLV